jgi:hypothetical protein
MSRKDKAIEFVTAWAEYELELVTASTAAASAATQNAALHQAIRNIPLHDPPVRHAAARDLAIADVFCK